MIVQISAGQGPSECQLAVTKLYEALKKEYGDFELLSETRGYEKGCFDSIRFRTDQEYRIEKFRCGGKGGQNVNKVETGVRITHIPTGLISQCTEERSQFQNKRRAMEKLQEKLADLKKEQETKQKNSAWREHTRIVRGNPVRIYEGEEFVRKK